MDKIDTPKFVLVSEINIQKEKVSQLKDLVSVILEKVEEVSSDKKLELIKRKLHTDFINHLPRTFDRDIEDWFEDILFDNKTEGDY